MTSRILSSYCVRVVSQNGLAHREVIKMMMVSKTFTAKYFRGAYEVATEQGKFITCCGFTLKEAKKEADRLTEKYKEKGMEYYG